MAGGISLVQGERLVELTEEGFASEDFLQSLLATHPSLLAGDLMAATPRRWLLISREASLPSEDEGPRRWSLDHLFVDQDAVPTLVEVKRSSDSRIRREVVGQMLDYAANAVVYWPVERLRATFEASDGAEERLRDFLDPDVEPDAFWEQAGTNLKAGKVRLIFVADEIPPELRRIVEFLNTQMNPADVLAVEIKQYVGEGLRTLVPRVIGQTAEAQMRKGRPEGRQWDEASFLDEIERRQGSAEAQVARQIVEWSRSHLPRFAWGKGASMGSFQPALDQGGHAYWPFFIWTYGRIEIQFQYMTGMPPFNEDAKRLEFLRRLNEVSGVQIPDDAIDRKSSLAIGTFAAPEALSALFEALEWFIDEARHSGS